MPGTGSTRRWWAEEHRACEGHHGKCIATRRAACPAGRRWPALHAQHTPPLLQSTLPPATGSSMPPAALPPAPSLQETPCGQEKLLKGAHRRPTISTRSKCLLRSPSHSTMCRCTCMASEPCSRHRLATLGCYSLAGLNPLQSSHPRHGGGQTWCHQWCQPMVPTQAWQQHSTHEPNASPVACGSTLPRHVTTTTANTVGQHACSRWGGAMHAAAAASTEVWAAHERLPDQPVGRQRSRTSRCQGQLAAGRGPHTGRCAPHDARASRQGSQHR